MDRPTAKEIDSKWAEFLTPEILRGKLISASIYLAAFELLKDSIIEHLRTFFSSGFDENGIIVGPRYQSEVLARNQSPLYASLSWLREFNVIDDKDLETFKGLKNARNRVAHEMHELASGRALSDYVEDFPKLLALLRKIEIWWIVNVEIATDEDLLAKDIDEDGIVPGPICAVSIMLDVALGSDEEANHYIKAFREISQKPNK